jgi:aspartate/methionine/tyrosine aminotransferase
MNVFRQEEFFEQYEFHCRYMLALSGVEPLSNGELADLVGPPGPEVEVGYTPSAGDPALRQLVAAQYPAASLDNILITVGAIEALLITVNLLVGAGDEAICMLPSYQPLHEFVTAAGATPRFVRLSPSTGFQIDVARILDAVTPRTRLVVVNAPHNPTGQDVPTDDLLTLAEDLGRRGVWLLVDEVFRRMWPTSRPTVWTGQPNVIVVDSLSKSFGLPGLRIGWLVSDPQFAVQGRQYRKYTSLNPGALDQAWAVNALRQQERLLARTHHMVESGLRTALDWFQARPDMFHLIPPVGGGLLFPRLKIAEGTHDFCVRLVEETGVLIAPGSDCYEMEGFLRVGFATRQLDAGLERFDGFLMRR